MNLSYLFSSAAGRCEAAVELKLLSGHPDPQPSPVDHPGWNRKSRSHPQTNPGAGDVLQRGRPSPGAARGWLGGGRQPVADPALPHQAGHEGNLPRQGGEQPHRLHKV